ncbi:CCR4-NOT transcription complex subunit 4-like isoform X2 [Mercenaria mercenaria]|uniref:CCR4-NOT transcription complex subunit 4-like isoform X2 n=1 Tax=Mercenaria mercenaria TaxID=6596 RepID=UPI00234EE4DA|nr:CCR4-NOT transcription complex subunit 4-like isoform X2 [Mercenaria mercenaria]
MSGNDEQIECPLCMEPLEIDDINFFPCTCGYQICRFCWHRIRTDENGLCPACRKAYPEDPAKFNPLTEDELQRIKKERRQKDLQRKQKAAENRKHLANVRVVQRNLVFVVGLSTRLADPEVLKKHEYFGKFGKIHKVVINQSTSYAGAQGPSASAYVTYNKTEDALKAIIAVNNVHIDGRTLKASLGTTKYCSHFLRGTQCPKTDCMYLHELGEEAASFTKEEIKHQEYEQKLLEQYINSQNTAQNNASNRTSSTSRKKASSPTQVIQPSQSPPQSVQHSPPAQSTQPRQNIHNHNTQQIPPHTANNEAWPSLQQSGGNANKTQLPNTERSPEKTKPEHNKAPGKHRTTENTETQQQQQHRPQNIYTTEVTAPPVNTTSPPRQQQPTSHSIINRKALGLDNTDNLSLFSSINGFHGARNPKPPMQPEAPEIQTTEIPDTIPVNTTTDWQAAFGFGQTTNTNKSKDWQDDDLGFDPLEESSRGLADLLEKENGQKQQQQHSTLGFSSHSSFQPHSRQMHNNIGQNLPPGFSLSHIAPQSQLGGTQIPQSRTNHTSVTNTDVLTSRMMGLMNQPLQNSTYPDMFHDFSMLGGANKDIHQQQQSRSQNDVFNVKDWQDGLRALLPNINISFGAPQNDIRTNTQHNPSQKNTNWSGTTASTDPSSWMSYDPAILTSSNLSDGNSLQDPHWLKSINQLTDLDTANHRLPFVHQFPVRNTVWPPQTHNPPPGFQTHIRPPLQTADPHKLAEGLQ